MKYFSVVLPFTLLLSLCAATPVQPRQAYDTPTPTLPSSTPSSSATCSCEPRICIQSWPQSCLCANQDKLDCYEKCGGDYPELQSCE
ncbi:hypothetical protein BFW01_g9218 [Lasiodiplodia theobromae]|uniref:Uncharacterized protein n=1 Tax=Lasiodiplodia theobromae TaxID=45133 RepID=A0A5N5D9A7_9PEZI|nr:uncharacterized protein LTHEOB_10224 [Lasiodiplodia theobromae]KAB2574406.1 hypothetical protein DBV05_g6949 [Lasiodiplodia theobromae]KAF4539292.1 hypothetical protein LTHEOB_10224 [Lasiodiplodia theobromae]KAF9638321.1 hypothetical protein BFW01_g9218 [Lasiodiplodia theobromae]